MRSLKYEARSFQSFSAFLEMAKPLGLDFWKDMKDQRTPTHARYREKPYSQLTIILTRLLKPP
jgi:hypothetical protein